jgi:hypothetical protein
LRRRYLTGAAVISLIGTMGMTALNPRYELQA